MIRKNARLSRRHVLLGAAASVAIGLPLVSTVRAAETGKRRTTVLLSHPSFLNHDMGESHPEGPERMRALDKAFKAPSFAPLVRETAPWPDDLETAIVRAHSQEHYNAIKAARPKFGSAPVHLDGDTVMSFGTWEAASRAVGAGLRAVDRVMDAKDPIKNAFCQVRPPGHHAESNRAMGFCLFNNIAIAALYARAKHGAERVAVVDFDVHHGNGTQDIFWSDKDLFFGSTHQMPLFPGTGAVDETGVGNIFNGPLNPGDGSEAFRQVFASRILKNLEEFSPDVILISAGFDAHTKDPLAQLHLVEADFFWATKQLLAVADRHANGRVVSMLEGGYDLDALASSAGVHVKALMEA